MTDRTKLEQLREALDRIDAALIDQAAERQRLVSEIGQLKQHQGRQLRDYRREREVLDGVRARAEQVGLEPDLAESLLKSLIEASLTRQEQQRISRSARGTGQRVLLIGGAGLMGQWLARYFDSQGFAVQISDPAWCATTSAFADVPDWQSGSYSAEIVVICTPIAASRKILQQLTDLHEQQPVPALVFDIASVKAPLVEVLRAGAESGLRLCSIHPMFGPDTVLLAGRHILFSNVGNAEAVRAARALFEETMVEQVDVTLDQHDRLMAMVLGLSHALNIAFADTLVQSGLKAEQLAAISSTTFKRQLAIAGDVVAENDRLYFEIQQLNPHELDVLDGLLSSVQQLRSHVAEQNQSAFSKQMKSGHHWLQAMQASQARDPADED